MTVTGTQDGLWLADGGIETDLIFHHGRTLPEFAAFVLLDEPAGVAALADVNRRAVALLQSLRGQWEWGV